MIRQHIARSLLATSLACGLIVACGGDSASRAPLTAPGAAALDRGERETDHDDSGRRVRATTCETRLMANASGVFGPAGGTLLFGTSRLIIPGGALKDTVTISATIPYGVNSRVEFRPTGLQFAKPAGLLLDTSGCSMDPSLVPDVVYLSESGVILERIPAVYDPHWQTIAAGIWHFSGYAIAF